MSIINNIIVSVVQLMPKPVVRFFSNRYIAGDHLNDAVRMTKELNKKGIYSTIDVLGEAITTKEEAINAHSQCLAVLEVIHKEKLMSNLSIKPTQMALQIDFDFCVKQVRELCTKAREYGTFVRLDMEDATTTDDILRLHRILRSEFDNVGVVIQSYLRRTVRDIEEQKDIALNYRLCKGIYIEAEEIAFKGREEIQENYLLSLRKMFEVGAYVGIATHDIYLIEGAKKIINEMKVDASRYEFQMLLGVKEDLRDQLNAEGFKVRIYVPFGKDWYKYSIRRLKENPQVAGHIVKNIFSLN
ncbi:MAG: proline dehydrogenase family protein [Ignavibacteriaceae bacterium]|nr:proline dehydrogenase family protein [Ignavibacteriaceae bacterium]